MKQSGKVGNKQNSIYTKCNRHYLNVHFGLINQKVKRNLSFVEVLDIDAQDLRS